MTKIRPKLYVSGIPSVNSIELDRHGITAILCCDHNLIPDLHSIREKYKWNCIHFHDMEMPNPRHMLECGAKTVDHLLENGETVLVHCYAGQNRSPSVIAAYLVMKEGGEFDHHWKAMRKLRPQMQPFSYVKKHLIEAV